MAISTSSDFTAGSIVRARGRDWIVLPREEDDVLRLRPLVGGADEAVGLFVPLEGSSVRPSEFQPPDPTRSGDVRGGILLSDAARLSLRSGAVPFRSLGRLSVTPRPYQFVPLIMALRQETVRLLIADDVGVGKTIEAAMIARELLDRGIAKRLAVVCPAHLCEQWAQELREKFSIDAAVVQPARIGQLERNIPRTDVPLYRYYQHLIVSIDFVKSGSNRAPFLDNSPDLVIVDEAHITERPGARGQASQHQRYELVRALAGDPDRHLILVTATPHSGVEDSFRSLLGMLNPDFDMDATVERRQLLPYVVQRRRQDLERWLGIATPFPKRAASEVDYSLSGEYYSLFQDVLAYCRQAVRTAGELGRAQQRVRYWGAIALLRCVLSSPNAAVSMLGARGERQGLDLESENNQEASAQALDEIYAPQLLDSLEQGDSGDYVPSGILEDSTLYRSDSEKRQLSQFMQRARKLAGTEADTKLVAAGEQLRGLLAGGFRPIVFCHFIDTAKYLEEWLPRLLSARFPGVRVKAVTGEIGDEQRRELVQELAKEPTRVLVATDCLSEGINLQEHFDAVLHYDLPWNPNRLEQREGRVDRFGQQKSEVRAVILSGVNNPIDRTVLRVLIRKARAIRSSLGISVPVPAESEQVIQAVVDSVLLQAGPTSTQQQLPLEFQDPQVSQLHRQWDAAAERQGAFFRQQSIQPEEVAQELEQTDPVLGTPDTIQSFLANAVQRLGGELRTAGKAFELLPSEMASRLRLLGYTSFPMRVTFDRFSDGRAEYLGRTHPIVEAYCEAVLGRALAPEPDPIFARSGAIYTSGVDFRTVVLLLRLRYLLRDRSEEYAEEIVLASFQSRGGQLSWLEPLQETARDLMERATPTANMSAPERREQVGLALRLLSDRPDWFEPIVAARVQDLQESNNRLRKLVRASRLKIDPKTPPDILGCYVFVPAGGGR